MWYYGKFDIAIEMEVARKTHDAVYMCEIANQIIKRGAELHHFLSAPWVDDSPIITCIGASAQMYEQCISFTLYDEKKQDYQVQTFPLSSEKVQDFIVHILTYSESFDLSPDLLLSDFNEYHSIMMHFIKNGYDKNNDHYKHAKAKKQEIEKILKKMHVRYVLMENDTYGKIRRF